MMRRTIAAAVALMACFAIVPAAVQAQGFNFGIGGGVAFPYGGDFGDDAENGYTVRAQAGLGLVLVDIHVQGGWTHLGGNEDEGIEDSFNMYHIGPGARLGLGFIWVGANLPYFFGDGDDGFQVVPEIGAGLGPVEVVGDIVVTGDTKWYALRVNLHI